jgi:hypothetical protein
MWRHSTASSSRIDYLRQVLDSARAAKALNPALPVALATNVRVPPNSSLDVIYTLSAPSNSGGALRAKWIFRLLAIAGSPFELTLAVDASVTVCSSRLHAAMQSELARNRFDFAVGFEAVSQSYVKPHRIVDVLPHNFAFAFRRGRAWQRLHGLWTKEMMRSNGDDQYTLRSTLRKLSSSDGLGQGGDRIRVMRLLGSMAAFKSLDKAARLWWPRYTWPFAGEALLLHSYDEAILRNAPAHPNICAAMNERAPAWRMIAQDTHRSGYQTHTTQRGCVQEVTSAVGNATLAAAPARVCRLLASPPAGALAELQRTNAILAEPLSTFWAWMRASSVV